MLLTAIMRSVLMCQSGIMVFLEAATTISQTICLVSKGRLQLELHVGSPKDSLRLIPSKMRASLY